MAIRHCGMAVLACLLVVGQPLGAAEVVREFDIRALVVMDGGLSGGVVDVNFRLSRRDDSRAPVTIATSEDHPAGAGESIRAAAWMAATVAALERLDDLAGVRVSMHFPGLVDGPSAGALMCLAMLSALDGREVPADVAITGSILPDGTIGVVGGVNKKMEAAARRGAKRFLLPAYLRFEIAADTGREIDLKRHAAHLGMEYIPVRSIQEAYRIAHKLPAVAAPVVDRSVLRLPEATEELLKQWYARDGADGQKLWEAIPEADRADIEGDPIARQLLVAPLARAREAYRSGNLLRAYSAMIEWRMMLQARQRNVEFIGKLPGGPASAEGVQKIDARVIEVLQTTPSLKAALQRLQDKPMIRDTAAQVAAEYADVLSLPGIIVALEGNVEQLRAELAKDGLEKEQREQLTAGLANAKAWQLLVAHAAVGIGEEWTRATLALADTLPRREMTGDVAATERLFFAAFMAAHNMFEKDVVRQAAQALNMGEQQVVAAMKQHDSSLVMYDTLSGGLRLFQRDLTAAGPARFERAVASHAYASALAMVAGLITRWNELDFDVEQADGLRYGRTGLLNYMLNNAREAALAAIAECVKRDIPCVTAISFFEAGELTRDDRDTDSVDVLTSYWQAGLQAKAMLMLFGTK